MLRNLANSEIRSVKLPFLEFTYWLHLGSPVGSQKPYKEKQYTITDLKLSVPCLKTYQVPCHV